MAATPRIRPSPSVSNRKAKRQKQCRRKSSLMKKASEYSKMCDADVCLGIRLVKLAKYLFFWRMLQDFGPFLALNYKKVKRQKQCHRKSTLMIKVCEYSKMCDTDVCLGILLCDTGEVYILSADALGFWAFLGSQLNSYYPTPKLVTDRDLEVV
ncbi:hypothetical protein N7530_009143 [Penicillium desertorum]|uniref:MADS-box domain-containing protein n=1 Tax=Penicillium desertorum TaxID=1303715 RepID=A0A9X0BLH9_9EURO|nr:hypothetical protein N7530_009143 [Penicillium desertorum]